MPLNPYSEEERLQAMLSACYAAAQSGFRHLALRHIINPPHEWFDAALARQIAIHILATRFDVPRRRIVEMQQRQRTSISFAIRAIDNRLEDPVFERAYRRMSERAGELFDTQIRKAAA
jgi:hypothetical protein